MNIDINKPLVISKYLHIIRRNNRPHIAYHKLYGNLSLINNSALQLLDMFARPTYPGIANSSYANFYQYIQSFYNMYLLVEPGFDERRELKKELKKREQTLKTGSFIGGVQLSVADTCNFNCIYCFCDFVDQREAKRRELSKRKDKLMTLETALNVIDKLIDQVKKSGRNALMIKFFGREPLINWTLIKKIMTHYRHGEDKGIQIHYAITTNASLVTPEIAETLRKYNVRATVSIDGLEDANDKIRVNKKKESTFPTIEKGIKLLAKHNALHVFSAVITDDNFDIFDIRFIDFAKKYGVEEVQILLGMQGDFINRINPDTIVQKLFNLYVYGKRVGIAVTGYWHNSVVEILSTRKLKSDIKTIHGVVESCTATGYQLSVEPSGDIFPCRAMSTYMGHISRFEELLKSDIYKHVVMRTYNNVPDCHGCNIEGFCQGECLGNVEEKYKDIYRADEIYCDIYKKINHMIISLL